MDTKTKTELEWTRLREFDGPYSYLLTHRAVGENYIFRICRWIYKPGTELEDRTEMTWTVLVHSKSGLGTIVELGSKGWKTLPLAKAQAQSIDRRPDGQNVDQG